MSIGDFIHFFKMIASIEVAQLRNYKIQKTPLYVDLKPFKKTDFLLTTFFYY
jgi:hypothetical protein